MCDGLVSGNRCSVRLQQPIPTIYIDTFAIAVLNLSKTKTKSMVYGFLLTHHHKFMMRSSGPAVNKGQGIYLMVRYLTLRGRITS